MTATTSSDLANATLLKFDRVTRRAHPVRKPTGARALTIIAIGIGLPSAFIAVSLWVPEDALLTNVTSPLRAAQAGAQTDAFIAAPVVLGKDVQLATTPCLALAPADEPPLSTAIHVSTTDALQSPPSIECLPPTMAAAPVVQPASHNPLPAIQRPTAKVVALKELPRAVERPTNVAVASVAVAAVAVPTPQPAPRGLPVRPTIVSKGAQLQLPDGMTAPGFAAHGAPPPVGEVRAPLEVRHDIQMGVTSAVQNQPLPAAGTPGGAAGMKGKTTQTAQIGVGQWGSRPPEQLPWLEPDGSSRRSSLGATNKGGATGQIQVFGKTVATGAPKWSEDIYKSRQ
jgi:hypothetical protein